MRWLQAFWAPQRQPTVSDADGGEAEEYAEQEAQRQPFDPLPAEASLRTMLGGC